MGETADQIERYIREQRNELGRNLSEIQRRVKNSFDWRAQFEQRPMTMIGIALGGGILLSALAGPKSRSRSLNHYPAPPPTAPESRLRAEAHPANGPSAEALESWRQVKTALIGVATVKLVNLLFSAIPGFSTKRSRRPNNGAYQPAD